MTIEHAEFLEIMSVLLCGVSAIIAPILFSAISKHTKEKQVSNNVMTLNSVDCIEQKYKKQKGDERTKTNDKNDYDEAISRLIQEHHRNALREATIYFWLSLTFSVIGFAVIVYFAVAAQGKAWYEYAVSILPGVLVEVISVLFFTQSKATRERGGDFLDRLREDRLYKLQEQRYEKGLSLIEAISDETLKSKLRAEIAMRLCTIQRLEAGAQVRVNNLRKQLLVIERGSINDKCDNKHTNTWHILLSTFLQSPTPKNIYTLSTN